MVGGGILSFEIFLDKGHRYCLEFVFTVLIDVEDMFFSGVVLNRVVDVP